MSGMEQKLLGRWGEVQVAEYLRNQGYRIKSAGWKCRFSEIDLVATNDKYICFVEVKLRKDDHFAPGRAFVNDRKQRKLRTAAELYLAEYPDTLQPRFDVAEVYAPNGTSTRTPQINYLQNAF